MQWSNELEYNYPRAYLIVGKLRQSFIQEGNPAMPSPAMQQPSPQLFFQTINSYQRTEALKAAIELWLFTAIGEGNSAVLEIADQCHTSERGILCDYLCTMGF